MIEEALGWYVRQMRSMLPGASGADAVANGLVMVVSGPGQAGFQLLRRRNRVEASLGRYAMDEAGFAAARGALGTAAREPATVRVPAACLLERSVTLPLAAERDLDRALAYEMDRLTPFAADAVYWTHAVERRDRARQRLTARLSLIPRPTLAPALDALARIGVRPARIEAAVTGGTRVIALVHDAAAAPRARVVARAGYAACGVLAALVLALPFLRQSAEMARLDAREAALAPEVSVAERLRARLGEDGATAALAADHAHAADLLRALATATTLLPDDTYLTEFSLRQGKVGMSGESPSAAKLIPLLAADASLRNPSFVAPVTRSADGQREHFAIRADLGS